MFFVDCKNDEEVKEILAKKRKDIPYCFVMALVNSDSSKMKDNVVKWVKEAIKIRCVAKTVEVDLNKGEDIFEVLNQLLKAYFYCRNTI